jgi:hypothetical protein
LSNSSSGLYFYTCRCIFGGGYAAWLHRHILQEGGWDTGVGKPSSI